MKTNEMSENLALSINAVDFWSERLEGFNDPEYVTAFPVWDAALVANRVMRNAAYTLAVEELECSADVAEASLGFSYQPLGEKHTAARIKSALTLVEKEYVDGLSTVSSGGLLTTLVLDLTKIELRKVLDTMELSK